MRIEDIKTNVRNPRYIKDEKFKELIKSIKEFPKMLQYRPIVLDDENVIIGGNMKYLALKELGYKEIDDKWVRKASDLTKEEIERFVILDNVHYGDWDNEVLINEWDLSKLAEWGLPVHEAVYEKYAEELYDEFEEEDIIEISLNISKKYYDEVYFKLKNIIKKNTDKFSNNISKDCENFLFYSKAAYAKPVFNHAQMKEIKYGLMIGVDVSWYAIPDFEWWQMYEIRQGLEKKLDVSKYATPDFNFFQMEQIRFGLEEGIDVSKYTNPEFSWQKMEEIRLILKIKKDEYGIDLKIKN